jgi:aspartate carbamoyltransferase catalytic subunit
VGDLKYGRAAHSFAYALTNYDVKLYLISPEALRLRREVLEEVRRKLEVKEVSDLSQVIPKLDVMYMTRIQRERYADPAEYEKIKNSYVLTANQLNDARDQLIVMHPLPRVDEVEFDVDKTKHAKYFKQVWYGMLVRMGLLSLVLGAVD